MSDKGTLRALLIGGSATLLLAPAALAASAALPQPAKDFSSGGYHNHVSLSLVTSVDGKRIQPGGAPLGANFAVGGIYVQCPSAPKIGVTTPFAAVPFPGLALRRSHGHYGFSRTFSDAVELGATSKIVKTTLKVTFIGSVASPTLITGTVKITGRPCQTTAHYSAKVNNSIPVAPGA